MEIGQACVRSLETEGYHSFTFYKTENNIVILILKKKYIVSLILFQL